MTIRPTSPAPPKNEIIEEPQEKSELEELVTTVLVVAALYFTSLWDSN